MNPQYSDDWLERFYSDYIGDGGHGHKCQPEVRRVGKTLSLELAEGFPATRRRVETQILHFDGIDWLARHFPDHRVHAVNFPGDPYPIHIDATFTPLRPGLILNNPQRRLPDDQREMFHKNGWEIVDSAQPAHNAPRKNEQSR